MNGIFKSNQEIEHVSINLLQRNHFITFSSVILLFIRIVNRCSKVGWHSQLSDNNILFP